MIGGSGHMRSSLSMTCLVDRDVCRSCPMDECCHGFAAGKLLRFSALTWTNFYL